MADAGLTPDQIRKQIQAGLNNYKVNQEMFEEAMGHQAKMLFKYYGALVSAGFTDKQAMEIITFRGMEG